MYGIPFSTTLGSRQSSRSPSPGRRRGSSSMGERGAYVVQAGRLIKQALSYERNAEYQEAFDLFKAGVDVLLNGVQSEYTCNYLWYAFLIQHL